MKFLLIGILTLMAQSEIVQMLKLHYYCSDVKIISEYTGDTISRCELFLNKEDALKKLGSNLDCIVQDGMFGLYEIYYLDKTTNELLRDQITYYKDSTYAKGGFAIFSKKLKLLIDNKYLVQVGDNIEEIFKEYRPIPIREDQKITQSAVLIYYKSKSQEENILKGCILAIKFDNKTKIIFEIGEFIDPGV